MLFICEFICQKLDVLLSIQLFIKKAFNLFIHLTYDAAIFFNLSERKTKAMQHKGISLLMHLTQILLLLLLLSSNWVPTQIGSSP